VFGNARSAGRRREAAGIELADVTKLPDFFTGNWRAGNRFWIAHLLSVHCSAQAYIEHYKPIADIPFAGPGCKTPGCRLFSALAPTEVLLSAGMIAFTSKQQHDALHQTQ